MNNQDDDLREFYRNWTRKARAYKRSLNRALWLAAVLFAGSVAGLAVAWKVYR